MGRATKLGVVAALAAAALSLAGPRAASAQTAEQTQTRRVVRATLDGEATSERAFRISPEGPVAPLDTTPAPRIYRATLDGAAAAAREVRVVRTELDGNVVAPLNTHRAGTATARLYRTEL